MPRTVRINKDYLQLGTVERQVVVAAVPQDHIGFLLRLIQYFLVVDTGINHKASFDVRFILLPLLDGAVVFIQIVIGSKPLASLFFQVAVWHGMADNNQLFPHRLHDFRHFPCGLAFTYPGPDGANQITGTRGLSMVVFGPIRRKSAPAAMTSEARFITYSWEASL